MFINYHFRRRKYSFLNSRLKTLLLKLFLNSYPHYLINTIVIVLVPGLRTKISIKLIFFWVHQSFLKICDELITKCFSITKNKNKQIKETKKQTNKKEQHKGIKQKQTSIQLLKWFKNRRNLGHGGTCGVLFTDLSKDFDGQACNFVKKETLAHVFSCEICEISWNTFFYRAPPMAASYGC